MFIAAAQRRRGFSLIELLVVIAIIAVLVGMLLAAIQKAREAANRTVCRNNLKQIGLAVHLYHDSTGFLPPSRLGYDGEAAWTVLLMPYLELNTVYDQWDLKKRYYVQPLAVREAQVKTYYCPSRRSPSASSLSIAPSDRPDAGWPDGNCYPGSLGDYACSSGNNSADGVFNTENSNGCMVIANYVSSANEVQSWSSRTTFTSITDGLSNTLLIGEKHVQLGKFGHVDTGDGAFFNGDPSNQNTERAAGIANPLAKSPTENYNRQFGSYHPFVCQFVLADGSVQGINVAIDGTNLGRLSARNDGEEITVDFTR